MPIEPKLSVTIRLVVERAEGWKDAIKEHDNCGVRFGAVCPLGQYGPDPHAKNADDQKKFVGLLKVAKKEVERLRSELLDGLLEAERLTRALATHEGLPSWSNQLPVLLATLHRLRGRVESTTTLLHLHRRGGREKWNDDLDSLLIWNRRIEPYEDVQFARTDSASKLTPAEKNRETSRRRPKRSDADKLRDAGKIAAHLVQHPDARRDEIAETTGIAPAHVSDSTTWKTHKVKRKEAHNANRARAVGGVGDPSVDRYGGNKDDD